MRARERQAFFYTWPTYVKVAMQHACRFSLFLLYITSTSTTDDTISLEKLIEFLNEKQRDPRLNEILYPHYNATRVREIISAYETDQNLVQQGKAGRES